jgi:Trk K+ transport system NAD-binding subunit
VALTRAGRAQLPSGEAVLEKDDVIHVSATLEGIEALRQRLSLSQEV